MDHDSLVAAVREAGDALVAAVAAGPVSTPVPTCAGWTMADLALHVRNFCGFWSHVLCQGTGRPNTPFPDPPAGDALVGWIAVQSDILVDLLTTTPAATEVWTWFGPDHSAGFVARRCAHELAVHRYDAQSARGNVAPIGAELAVDGVDEILDVLVTARERTGQGTGRMLALRSADAGLEWVVTLGQERIDVQRQDDALVEESALTVTGTASDLELTLYDRPTLSPVDISGDPTVMDEWHREFTF
jgi:uncharacterized protein (TIGR03083 family)